MTILSVSPQVPPAPVSPKHPTLRVNPPPGETRKTAMVGTWKVEYTGNLPTQTEVDAFIAAQDAKGDRATQAVGSINRLVFELLFRLENDKRDLRAKINQLSPNTYTAAEVAPISVNQFRQFLINRWNELNL